MAFFIVFLGGGLGAALRHGINLGVARLLGGGFPYATFFINVTGSFVMGLMAAWFAFKGGAPQHWRLFLTTGVLGGYTTFSTFSQETLGLVDAHDFGVALAYVGGSVLLGLLAVYTGGLLGKRI